MTLLSILALAAVATFQFAGLAYIAWLCRGPRIKLSRDQEVAMARAVKEIVEEEAARLYVRASHPNPA